MLNEFNMNYGTNGTKLAGWQQLCSDCGVTVCPSIAQCKRVSFRHRKNFHGDSAKAVQILVGARINIIDLINAKKLGRYPQQHRSARALAQYTREMDQVFPKSLAKENGFLKVLLVEVF
jgi:hypothetical protein